MRLTDPTGRQVGSQGSCGTHPQSRSRVTTVYMVGYFTGGRRLEDDLRPRRRPPRAPAVSWLLQSVLAPRGGGGGGGGGAVARDPSLASAGPASSQPGGVGERRSGGATGG